LVTDGIGGGGTAKASFAGEGKKGYRMRGEEGKVHLSSAFHKKKKQKKKKKKKRQKKKEEYPYVPGGARNILPRGK